MPYKLRKARNRDLYYVVNKDTGKKHSNEPLSKEKAKAQMRALYARESGYPPLKGRGDDEDVVADVLRKSGAIPLRGPIGINPAFHTPQQIKKAIREYHKQQIKEELKQGKGRYRGGADEEPPRTPPRTPREEEEEEDTPPGTPQAQVRQRREHLYTPPPTPPRAPRAPRNRRPSGDSVASEESDDFPIVDRGAIEVRLPMFMMTPEQQQQEMERQREEHNRRCIEVLGRRNANPYSCAAQARTFQPHYFGEGMDDLEGGGPLLDAYEGFKQHLGKVHSGLMDKFGESQLGQAIGKKAIDLGMRGLKALWNSGRDNRGRGLEGRGLYFDDL